MIKKNSILGIFIISLLGSVNSIAGQVDAALQFKNEDTQTITSTMQPYLDNFSWADLRPEYQANWTFPPQTQFFQNAKPLTKSFKDIGSFSLAPAESASAALSYYSNDSRYGMSQYAFNYEGRAKEYGCFITELRLSGLGVNNYNIVVAAYRQDPQHLDNYLTCSAEKNSATSFTIHMMSSTNKKDEKNIFNDSKRYSIVGSNNYLLKTGDILKTLKEYHIDRPIELWKDEKNQTAFVLKDEQPVIVPLESSQPAPKKVMAIYLINNTSQPLVAGQPLLDKFSRLDSQFYIEQTPLIQPISYQVGATYANAIKLASSKANRYIFARLNYHFPGAAEDSGCYITALLDGGNHASAVWTTYYFDHSSMAREKNLYCFIRNYVSNSVYVEFYEYPAAIEIKELSSIISTSNPYVSYSYTSNNIVYPSKRDEPFYDNGEQLTYNNSRYNVDFPIDPVHHYIVK